jgi:hypothetical protein
LCAPPACTACKLSLLLAALSDKILSKEMFCGLLTNIITYQAAPSPHRRAKILSKEMFCGLLTNIITYQAVPSPSQACQDTKQGDVLWVTNEHNHMPSRPLPLSDVPRRFVGYQPITPYQAAPSPCQACQDVLWVTNEHNHIPSRPLPLSGVPSEWVLLVRRW